MEIVPVFKIPVAQVQVSTQEEVCLHIQEVCFHLQEVSLYLQEEVEDILEPQKVEVSLQAPVSQVQVSSQEEVEIKAPEQRRTAVEVRRGA